MAKKTMKKSVKAKRGTTRDLFAELTEGIDALTEARLGKRTLRTHAVTPTHAQIPQRQRREVY